MNQTLKSLFPYYEKVDLSYREHWREYKFPNEERVRINSPQYLIVSDNGHRVMNDRGTCYYIPYGWIRLMWKSKEGYGFYCEGDDEIDPAEDVSFDNAKELKVIFDASVTPLVHGFLRYLNNQCENAQRLSNTIECQTISRLREKFLYLFETWTGKENEPTKEEPEQSSTESTE